jgi:hypothetical protein
LALKKLIGNYLRLCKAIVSVGLAVSIVIKYKSGVMKEACNL